jgi:hypothetical protein
MPAASRKIAKARSGRPLGRGIGLGGRGTLRAAEVKVRRPLRAADGRLPGGATALPHLRDLVMIRRMRASTGRWHPMLDLAGAALVAAAWWWLSEILVPSATAPFPGHGERFAQMSQAPWTFEGAFPHRILWPWLAWFAGAFGLSAVAFSQLVNGGLIATVAWFVRRRGASWLDAALVAGLVAVTGAVQVYKPMACFSDPLNLVALLLLVHFRARPFVFWGLVLVSALSHELVFFFAPWLVYLRFRNGGSWRVDGGCLLAAVAVYGAFRALVSLGIGGGSYDASYYFANNFWVPFGLPLMWALWAFVGLVEFGPALALVAAGRSGHGLGGQHGLGGRHGPWLFVLGVLPLMLLAYDVMRFAALLVVPVVLAAEAFTGRAAGRLVLAGIVVASAASYAWLHPVPSQQGGAHFTEITGHLFGMLQGRVTPGQPMAFADAMSLNGELFATCWPIAAWASGAVVLLVVSGRVLRRVQSGSANDGGSVPRTSVSASP